MKKNIKRKKRNSKKNKKVNIFIIIILIVIIMMFVFIYNNKTDKVLKGEKYILEKSSDNSDVKLPIVNLVGEDIDYVNKEIINVYYSVLYNENDFFQYEVDIYDNILSLLITATYSDDSEYGTIKYYSYNIDVRTSELLTDKELYNYLNINYTVVDTSINNKLKDYYNNDLLKKNISYNEYLEVINYNKTNNKLFIKDNKLYCYNVINLTSSLIKYNGNINEFEITNLK